MELNPVNENSDRLQPLELAAQIALSAQAREAQFAAVVENMAEAFFALDTTGSCTYLNRKAEALFKHDTEQFLLSDHHPTLLHKPLWEIFQVDTSSQLYRQYQQVVIEQTPLEFEEFYGSLNRWFAVRLFPVTGGLATYFQDITKRKQTEAALRKEQEFLNVLLDHVQAGIVACDAEGRLKLFNRAARSFHAMAEQPLAPEQWADQYDLYLPDGKTPMSTADIPLYRALQGQQVRDVEMMIIPKQGTARLLLASGQAIYHPDHQKQGAVVVMHDITERKQRDLERVQLMQEQTARTLAEADQRRSAFLADVSQALAASLDYEQTLQSVAQLAVPYFADWCSVDLLQEDGTINRVAVAHSDPEKVQLGWDLAQQFPRHLNDGYGIAQVMKTGKSEIAIAITDEQLTAGIPNLEYLEILRGFGLKSCIIAPLQARGRVLGGISFVFTESNRQYDMTDLELAEDLARRAAIAIDNAHLYYTAQQAKRDAETAADRMRRLQTVTAALSESLTPEQVAEVIVEQSMATLEATAVLVVLVSNDRTELEIVKSVGYQADLVESWQRFPISMDVPLAEAIRTGKPVWAEALIERIARYPHLAEVYSRYDFKSWIALPLVVEGKAVAGMLLSFKEFKHLSQDDRAFILALSRQCAQAISRAQLYAAERSARAEAEQANRLKDEFLAVLSHELRSPLNPILGWTHLLQNGKLDPACQVKALATIERNTKLQAQLVEDLLDISRIMQGKLTLTPAPTSLTFVIAAAIETVKLAADAKNIQIRLDLDSTIAPISGDAARLQQVVWNLLTNAVKFTPNSGQVTVELRQITIEADLRCNQLAQIRVSDTGIGISPQFLPHVFEYFRQEDGSTTRRFGGLGLGLAIARQIVEMHGGTVRAESPGENQGATFIVELPAMQQPATAILQPSRPAATTRLPLNNIRILLVDDDTDTRDFQAFLLEQNGATVAVAASGLEALQALEQFVPNVIISDVGMADMDGYTLMQQIRLRPAANGTVPAIALTAYAGEFNRQQALQAGFQQHLVKPIEPDKLIKAVAALIETGNAAGN